jgi:hypothetical protein
MTTPQRIDTQAAIEWARSVLARGNDLTGPEADEAQLEYNLALGITVDGLYQDVDNETSLLQRFCDLLTCGRGGK